MARNVDGDGTGLQSSCDAIPHRIETGQNRRAKQPSEESILARFSHAIGFAVSLLALAAACPAARAQSAPVDILHTFEGTDGSCPAGPLTEGPDGSWYGTTQSGGAHGGGTLYKLSRQGAFATLHHFDPASESIHPNGGLFFGADGHLYGTTYGDGGVDSGSLFRVESDGRIRTILRFPQGPLGRGLGPAIQGSDGNFYAVMSLAGAGSFGTVVRITPAGQASLLHAFTANGSGEDGSWPMGALVEAADGWLYGVTNVGGTYGYGTVYKVSQDGSFQLLHSFNPYSAHGRDGSQPMSGLALNGNELMGTTAYGGKAGNGTIFTVDLTDGSYQVAHRLAPEQVGRWPSSIAVNASGAAFVTTTAGAANGSGGVVRVAGGIPLPVYAFPAMPFAADAFPVAFARNGDIVGSACTSGWPGYVFRLHPGGLR